MSGVASPVARAVVQPVASPVVGDAAGGAIPWPTLRLTSPASGALLSEWWFDEGTGTSVADQVGSNDINLSAPTDPNATWTARGLSLASGLVQTPSITGVRTVCVLCREKKDETSGFLLSGGSVSGAGALGDNVSATYAWHVGTGRGMTPIYNATTATSMHQMNRGGWFLLICDFNTAYNTILGIGGRHSTTTSRCTEFEVAWCAVFSGVLTGAERDQVYLMSRALAKSRSFYIDYRDCPTIVDVAVLWGQSNAEGRALIADLSAGDQLRTNPSGVLISRRDTRVTAQLVMGTNQGTPNVATQFGPEMPMAWEAEDAGNGLYISKYGIGSTYLALTDGTDWNTGESPSTGHLNPALKQYKTMEADMLNAGIGPRLKGLCWMQGEQDATNATYGAAYEANLTAFVAKYREQVGDANARVIIARIRDQDPTFDAGAVVDVRAAQEAVGEADANSAWFDTDSFPLAVDAVHYTAAGMKLLGAAFYDALQA